MKSTLRLRLFRWLSFAVENKAATPKSPSAKLSKINPRETRLALIFLGLIMIPSGLLSYFSWRAIENEKVLSSERLQDSYRQFANLAAREIDHELEAVEKHWISAVEETFDPDEQGLAPTDLERLSKEEPLIAACFFLKAPGQVVYPPGLSLQEENSAPEILAKESYVREYEVFKELVACGEELEYIANDLQGAIATYREAASTLSNPQLRGMAKSYLGRALLKQGDWPAAVATFEDLLADYPEARDLNDMYLRFLAQYQIAIAFESMGRDQEAIQVLLRFHQDLFDRSDAITTLQYSYFLELIRNLAYRLLASPNLSDPSIYAAKFLALTEQNKKRVSQKYFLQLLDQELNERVIKRKLHKSKFRYVADEADNEPYLLAYRSLPDPSGIYTTGILGVQIDLAQLRKQLFPAILRKLEMSDHVTLAILNRERDYVIGTAQSPNMPIAVQTLAAPFYFWQVAIYLNDAQTVTQQWDFRTLLSLWLIALLLCSILLGAYLFIRSASRATYLSQMKSTFVSNVSHELRTPLASIKMLAELLQMQLTGQTAPAPESLKSRCKHYLGIIQRECGRLGRLIENVLDFSKIERGVKQYNLEYEDPGALVRLTVESFRPHAEAEGFNLETEINDQLPELRIDADAISQVMLNLLSNAMKYSDEVKEIRVRAYRDGCFAAIEVADHGIGIEPPEIPKIFDDFYRVDQRLNSNKQGGVGLGLTMARHIVRAHGGDICVKSKVRKGSTFTFTLPIPDEDTMPVSGDPDVFENTMRSAKHEGQMHQQIEVKS